MTSTDASVYLFDLFISYARTDDIANVDGTITRPIAELKEALETHRHPVTGAPLRVCTDTQDFELGGVVEGAIRAKLRLSRCLVVICSAAAVISDWVPRELGWFREERPDGQQIGIALNQLPHQAFPEWFAPGQLGGDLRPIAGERVGQWRARLAGESHRIAAAVWQLPLLEMHDRWQSERRAALSIDLSRRARALLTTETDHAALLALAAHNVSPTLEATDALVAVGSHCRRLLHVDDVRRRADAADRVWDAAHRYSAAISADGRVVVIVRRDDGSVFVRPTDGSSERCVAVIEPGLLAEPQLRISPDRRWLAIQMGSVGDDSIHVVRLEGDGHIRFWPPEHRQFRAFGFDVSSRLLYIVDTAGDVLAISPTDGAIAWRSHGPRSFDAAVVASPDGATVATVHQSRHGATVRLWDATTGREVRSERIQHCSELPALVFTADAANCVVARDDKRMAIIPIDAGAPMRTMFTGLVGQPVLAAGAKGRIAASAGDRIAVWTSLSADGPDTFPSPLTTHIQHMMFVPAQAAIVVSDDKGSFAVIDVVEQRPVLGQIRAFDGLVTPPQAGAQGRVITVHPDATVLTWDLAPPPRIGPFVQSWDGRQLASLRTTGVRLWDGATLRPIGATVATPDHAPTALALDSTGATLATAAADRSVRLWDTGARTALASLTGAGASLSDRRAWRAPTWELQFAPGGQRLAACASFADHGYTMHDEILVWDRNVPAGRLICTSPGEVCGIVWLDDDHLLVAEMSALTVWRIPTGERGWRSTFEEWEAVMSIAASIGSPPIWVAMHDDDHFRIYEGDAYPQIRDTVAVRQCPTISADRQRMAWLNGDAVVVWGVPERAVLGSTIRVGGEVRDITFSPLDGNLLVLRGDGRVERWPVATGALRALATKLVDPALVEERLAAVGAAELMVSDLLPTDRL